MVLRANAGQPSNERGEDFDEEQHFILGEVSCYLDCAAIDVATPLQMGSDWHHLMQKILGDAPVGPNDLDVLMAVKCWPSGTSQHLRVA